MSQTFKSDEDQAVDFFWFCTQTINIYLMQLGFAFIEAGSIRMQHIQSILLKNIMDICTGSITWYLLGFGFAYGKSYKGIIGTSYFLEIDFDSDTDNGEKNIYLEWLSSWAFQSTACTIISGAIAERMSLQSYLVLSSVTSIFLYPVVVHWVWNDEGWLKDLGYIDFAGDGPVHIVGGLCGLIATKLLGYRQGRFYKEQDYEELDQFQAQQLKKKQNQFRPSNIPYVVLGTMVLWYSWYSFNAGSVKASSSKGEIRLIGVSSFNTTIASVSGGLTVYFIQFIHSRFKYSTLQNSQDEQKQANTQGICMGILSGLIGITAGCDQYKIHSSSVIGIISALGYLGFAQLFLYLKIDDPLDAISLHLGCGIIGVLSVGLFNPKEGLFHTGSFKQLGIQILGIITICSWIGIMSIIVGKIQQRFQTYRITEEEEKYGFDDAIKRATIRDRNPSTNSFAQNDYFQSNRSKQPNQLLYAEYIRQNTKKEQNSYMSDSKKLSSQFRNKNTEITLNNPSTANQLKSEVISKESQTKQNNNYDLFEMNNDQNEFIIQKEDPDSDIEAVPDEDIRQYIYNFQRKIDKTQNSTSAEEDYVTSHLEDVANSNQLEILSNRKFHSEEINTNIRGRYSPKNNNCNINGSKSQTYIMQRQQSFSQESTQKNNWQYEQSRKTVDINSQNHQNNTENLKITGGQYYQPQEQYIVELSKDEEYYQQKLRQNKYKMSNQEEYELQKIRQHRHQQKKLQIARQKNNQLKSKRPYGFNFNAEKFKKQ